MNKTVKFIGNCALAIVAGLSIRACMLIIDDSINHYAEKAIISKYKNKSAEEIQKMVNTPYEAQRLIEARYGRKSFCLEGARAITAMIADDNFKPEIILIKKDNEPAHWICAFQENKKYGFTDNGIFGYQKAEYKTIDEMVKQLAKNECADLTYEYTKGLLASNAYSQEALSNSLEMLEADKKR